MRVRFGLLQLVLFSAALVILGGSAPPAGGSPANVGINTAGISAQSTLPCEWQGDVSKLPVIGTWINKDYNNDGRSGMVEYIADSDGTISYRACDNADGSGNVYKGKVSYRKRWTDEQGRQCGRCTVTLDFGMSWETLDRVSKDGKTLEVQSGVKTIDPKGPRYSIYYRK
jgi:hypothetical protein